VKLVLIAAGALVAAFVAVTGWALESGGVAVIETRDADGGMRTTRVWYAEPDGELWLEAGTPENPWFVDVQGDPAITFTSDAGPQQYVARAVEDPSGHSRIRSLLREKYGLRDRWIALIFDTSRSIAVRLVPAAQLKESP